MENNSILTSYLKCFAPFSHFLSKAFFILRVVEGIDSLIVYKEFKEHTLSKLHIHPNLMTLDLITLKGQYVGFSGT